MAPKRTPKRSSIGVGDVLAARKYLAESSLYEFVKQAWNTVVPEPYQDAPHIKAICEALQKCYRREIQNLVINVPPGHAKSLLTCVFFPAWVWIHNPRERFLCGSHSLKLAGDHSLLCRTVIESNWYQSNWGSLYQLRDDQNTKTLYQNTLGGGRGITSPSTKSTGISADILVVDDAHEIQDTSESSLEAVSDWFNTRLRNRIRNPKTGVKIIIGQRVHENDISSIAINQGFSVLCFPAEYEPNHPSTNAPYALSSDWRTEEGELLWPSRFSKEYLDEEKHSLGSVLYAAIYQQRPAPPGGAMVKVDWLRYFNEPPEQFDTLLQSWDVAATANKTSDYTVGQLWGRKGAHCYLLDQVRGKWEFPELLRQFKAFCSKHPAAATKLVESTSNGKPLIQSLQNEIQGIVAVTVAGKGNDKVSRLEAVTPLFEAGNVYLPRLSWVDEYVAELTSFPKARHDDQVDATSQALSRLSTLHSHSAWYSISTI